MGIFEWLKNHKIVVLLILIVAYLLLKDGFYYFNYALPPRAVYDMPYSRMESKGIVASPMMRVSNTTSLTGESGSRIVIQENSMALVVNNVRKVGDEIVKHAESKGGFMVQTTYSNPEESPFATITVRVPVKNVDEAIGRFRSLAVKVSSESIMGTDVTEQYVNIEERLDTLKKTKARFGEILDKATQVQDILNVQRELVSLQEQIDSLVGQQKAIEKSAEFTKITVYLSSDELALPYVPDKSFRPNLIFKQAFRSLVETLRWFASAGIWLAVFSVIWVPIVLVIIIYKRRQKLLLRKQTKE